MKQFEAVRKPIYIAKIKANGKDFAFASLAVKAFKANNPDYESCEYDSSYDKGVWTIKLYRECAIDFVEL